MIRLAKKKNLRRNKTRLELWEEHLEDPIVALDKALKCVWKVSTEAKVCRDLVEAR